MLEKIKTKEELAYLLSVQPGELETIQVESLYNCFEIRKQGSSEKRLIETPVGILRDMLDRIGDDLQNIYRYRKTDAAYGFIRCGRYDPDRRNIVTNARKHLGKKYLLNIDLDNFFHQVDMVKVHNIFCDYSLFHFDSPTENLLTRLVTFRGRLPMGSPTSPPLSNFATIALDKDLLAWANQSRFVYTRYVDDLSFSSNMKISDTHFSQISRILLAHRFAADPQKIKWYGRDDEKEITGLLLSEKIRIPDAFLNDFDKDLDKFKEVWLMAHQYPDQHIQQWLNKMIQVISGRLAFLSAVYRPSHSVYRRFVKRFNDIKHSHETELSCNWRYAGYEI